MNVDSIRAYCKAFPRVTEKLQWGDDLCFKIEGKIFAILGLDSHRVCFKCTPDSFAELIEREGIRPALYVGRYKWALLEQLDALRDQELQDLIQQSYEMVVLKAGKKARSKPNRTSQKKRAERERPAGKAKPKTTR